MRPARAKDEAARAARDPVSRLPRGPCPHPTRSLTPRATPAVRTFLSADILGRSEFSRCWATWRVAGPSARQSVRGAAATAARSDRARARRTVGAHRRRLRTGRPGRPGALGGRPARGGIWGGARPAPRGAQACASRPRPPRPARQHSSHAPDATCCAGRSRAPETACSTRRLELAWQLRGPSVTRASRCQSGAKLARGSHTCRGRLPSSWEAAARSGSGGVTRAPGKVSSIARCTLAREDAGEHACSRRWQGTVTAKVSRLSILLLRLP